MNSFEEDNLQPLPTHPNQEATEKKIFFPSWNCFCCEDSGFVRSHLVRLVMPTFDWRRDKLPRCSNCNAISTKPNLAKYNIVDKRFSMKLCVKLDKKSREDWALFAKNQQRNVIAQKAQQAAIELAQNKSLRKRDRTPHEDLAQQQKHSYTRKNWDLDLKTEELENEYSS